MIVAEEIRIRWSNLKEHGDAKEISDKSGVDYQIITRALRTGEMTEEVFKVVNGFYAERAERIKAELEKSNF
jgi:hypothetical protein